MFGEFNNLSISDKQIQNSSSEFDISLKERIIEAIAQKTYIVLKSQQKHEPDFTKEERRDIVKDILVQKPCQFLFRFGKYLEREHLQYFITLPQNEEIKFYIAETQKLLNRNTMRIKTRNRRFGALRRMQSSGSYFSEDEMRKRDPLLYDDLIDSNLTEEEKNKKANSGTPSIIETFSDLLFEQIERNIVRDKKNFQQQMEDDCAEEEDEEESDSSVEDCKEAPLVDEMEKELLRNEFHSLLYSRFISGKEKDFDYSQIDTSLENDLLELEAMDEEERYFEEEEEGTETVEEIIPEVH